MTEAQISKLRPGKILWDDKVKGLHVKALATKKSFYFYYRFQGQQRRPRIGTVGSLTLADARKAAQAMTFKIVMGEDPSAEKEAIKHEKTVSEWFEEVREVQWDPYTKWGREVERLFNANLREPFGKKKMSQITSQEVREWLASYADRPYEGNRALSILNTLYNIFEPPVANPCARVKKFQEHSRDRVASPEEIKAIGQILEREAKVHPIKVAYIYFMIYTGCRPKVIESFTRDMLRGRTLRFKGKSGTTEKVIVPKQVRPLLRMDTPTLIPARLDVVRDFWNKIRKEIGAEDLRLRDLRRTFASVALSKGENLSMIGELLNHRSTQTTKIYAKLMDGPREEAAQRAADNIEELLK